MSKELKYMFRFKFQMFENDCFDQLLTQKHEPGLMLERLIESLLDINILINHDINSRQWLNTFL